MEYMVDLLAHHTLPKRGKMTDIERETADQIVQCYRQLIEFGANPKPLLKVLKEMKVVAGNDLEAYLEGVQRLAECPKAGKIV